MLRFLWLLPLLCVGCTTINSTSRQEKERVEVSMHKIRTDLEEIKHDLNTHQVELHILEGKLMSHEDEVSTLKDEKFDKQQFSIRDLQTKLFELEKQMNTITQQQKNIVADLKNFQSHAKQTHTALTQYKGKFQELEKYMHKQQLALKEMKLVKEGLSHLLNSQSTYIVKSGDSLEKIAKMHQITIDSLRKANHLKKDLIIVGQELVIPNSR